MLDLERLDSCEVMMGRRMIEKLCERETQMDKALPVEIAKDDTLPRFALRRLDQPHLLAEIAPDLTVVDHAIDPGPKLRIDRRAEFFLPPEIERKIGIELRENNVRAGVRTVGLRAEMRAVRSKPVCVRPG